MFGHTLHELVADTFAYIHNRMHGLFVDVEQGRRRLTEVERATLCQHYAAMQRFRSSKTDAERADAAQAIVNNAFRPLYGYASVYHGHSELHARDLRPHDTRNAEFTCPTCERRLSSRRRLKEHSLIHESYGSRPYTCATCPKRFLSLSDCAKHTKTCPARFLKD